MLLFVLFVTLGAVLPTKQDACRGFSPIPTENCNEYMLMHYGKPYIYECPDGLLFNKQKLVCDLPENTDCMEPNECIRNGIECPRADSDHPVFRPLPNCTEFCECSNGVPYVRSCPAKLHWNPKLNTCDFPEYAGCATRTTTPAPTTTSLAPETTTSKSEEDIGTEVCLKEGVVCYGNEPEYHATSDCSKFCQCAYGRPYLKVCQNGLHFNPKLNVCDWPENAGCESSTTTEPSTTTLEPATRSAEEGTRICRNQGVTCPRVDPRTPIYSAVSHCTQFCECSNGTPYLFDCPGGTLFNENLDVCDYPYNVHCRV